MGEWDGVWFEKNRYTPKLKRLDGAAAEPAQRIAADRHRRTYVARPQFVPFHARRQRFACIVTHRRAGSGGLHS
jgi:hypothetical protein